MSHNSLWNTPNFVFTYQNHFLFQLKFVFDTTFSVFSSTFKRQNGLTRKLEEIREEKKPQLIKSATRKCRALWAAIFLFNDVYVCQTVTEWWSNSKHTVALWCRQFYEIDFNEENYNWQTSKQTILHSWYCIVLDIYLLYKMRKRDIFSFHFYFERKHGTYIHWFTQAWFVDSQVKFLA